MSSECVRDPLMHKKVLTAQIIDPKQLINHKRSISIVSETEKDINLFTSAFHPEKQNLFPRVFLH